MCRLPTGHGFSSGHVVEKKEQCQQLELLTAMGDTSAFWGGDTSGGGGAVATDNLSMTMVVTVNNK